MDQNKLLVKLENAGVYRSSKWLVRGISLEINQGQIVTLIGPNGSGKTTTAKMILNILNTDEGLVTGNANKMAYVPQKINIDWTMPLRVIDFMKITSSLNNNQINESLNMTGVDKLPKLLFLRCSTPVNFKALSISSSLRFCVSNIKSTTLIGNVQSIEIF